MASRRLPEAASATPRSALTKACSAGSLASTTSATSAVTARRHWRSRRIKVVADGNLDPNILTPVTVTVRLKDGRELARTIDTVHGNPATPMSREAHLAKFRRNFSSALNPLPRDAVQDRAFGGFAGFRRPFGPCTVKVHGSQMPSDGKCRMALICAVVAHDHIARDGIAQLWVV
jgi:hypothetical protein